ncbi:uncharacterized protein RHO25_008722 [Cercospora beticola]|uniref:DNA recombination and repair protein Rad51-like C-terminal domain-containing protein n=2 Tax=Cercospora beticola TaxID=122368 RepID=A0ABZ0NX19_CERBT|nr:hypothetical protein RHO25_008722 [Cercospora beticola]CAK1357129.1 unnamed protein product [Cercospora beticola]
MSVEDLGKKLLAEVEEVGLDEILKDLRLQQDDRSCYFGLPQLDALVQCKLDLKATVPNIATPPPIVELMSHHTCSGKTQLLYHLTALAVLPRTLGGRQAAVIYFDLDKHFSVTRLAQQIKRLLLAQSLAPNQKLSNDNVNEIVSECLLHVQIYHSYSLSKTVSTLNNLQSYLFDSSKHHSFDRTIAFIAVDSASALYWQTRFETEEAALLSSTSNKSYTEPPRQPIGYTHLAAALQSASRTFSAPIIYTVRDYNPPAKASSHNSNHHQYQLTNSAFGSSLLDDAYALRPSLPAPFNSVSFATLRLIMRRGIVRKLPIEVTVEDALQEESNRRKVTDQGKFECFVNEWGVDDKVMDRLRAKGALFEVFITGEGIKVGDGPE